MKAIKRLRMLLDEAWVGPLKLQTARYPDHPNQVHIVRECNGVILAVVDAPGSRGTALAEVFADGSTLLPALLDVAEAAGRMLATTPTTLECDDFHHPPKDQHGFTGGPCEPLVRQRAASEALSAALARLEGVE